MSGQTFLDMAQDLMLDPDAKAAFETDPDGFLTARGFDGLSPDDVTDAVGFVSETLPPGPAQALSGPEDASDALDRLARVDPTDLAVVDPEPVVLPDDDPSGELDLEHTAAGMDPLAAVDPEVGEADPGFERLIESEPDPGFGVGYGLEDVDDVSPAGFEEPLVDLDATLVPDLALEPDGLDDAFGALHHTAPGDAHGPLIDDGHDPADSGVDHPDLGLDLDL